MSSLFEISKFDFFVCSNVQFKLRVHFLFGILPINKLKIVLFVCEITIELKFCAESMLLLYESKKKISVTSNISHSQIV